MTQSPQVGKQIPTFQVALGLSLWSTNGRFRMALPQLCRAFLSLIDGILPTTRLATDDLAAELAFVPRAGTNALARMHQRSAIFTLATTTPRMTTTR